MKQLEEHARKLAALFDDPEPGLATWSEAVQNFARAIRDDVLRLEGKAEKDEVSRTASLMEVARASEAMRPIFDGFVRPYLRPGNFVFGAALDEMAKAAIAVVEARR